jgi:hypothetical protein
MTRQPGIVSVLLARRDVLMTAAIAASSGSATSGVLQH